ncbi:hypothetical protein HKCCE2091_06935 [Rhodobacterales bacterium HKCCE2091]|nr:hypothetical protein [Rhodobacterales bacterium HKCCE2091]
MSIHEFSSIRHAASGLAGSGQWFGQGGTPAVTPIRVPAPPPLACDLIRPRQVASVAAQLRGMPVVAVAGDPEVFDTVVLDEAELGRLRFTVGDFTDADRILARVNNACLVLVDIDTFPAPAEAMMALMEFRQRAPENLVVIGSRAFGADDPTTERLPIADASVRLPATRGSLVGALAAAAINNRIFRARLESGRKSRQAINADA